MIQKTGRFPCTLPGRGDRADLSCESNPAHRLPLCAKSHRTGSPSLPVLYPVSGFKHISAQTCLHVILHQLFQNFVTFYLHNQASGALMAGNVGPDPPPTLIYPTIWLMGLCPFSVSARHVTPAQEPNPLSFVSSCTVLKTVYFMNHPWLSLRPFNYSHLF